MQLLNSTITIATFNTAESENHCICGEEREREREREKEKRVRQLKLPLTDESVAVESPADKA